MSGPHRIRDAVLVGCVAGHALASVDPVLAAAVSEGLAGSVVPGTRKSYGTAVAAYLSFCMARKISPFPADEIWLCAYIRYKAMFIQHQSFGVYLAGIKYEHSLRGAVWALDGNVLIRRMLRFVKRRYPRRDAVMKMPISLTVLRLLLPLLPGWPDMASMSHDHRLVAAASLIGTGGFLRGGEFLSSSASDRPVLLGAALVRQDVAGAPAVLVDIPQPKARWWIAEERIVCFEFDTDGPFNPGHAIDAYRALSAVPLGPHLPMDPPFRGITWFVLRLASLPRPGFPSLMLLVSQWLSGLPAGEQEASDLPWTLTYPTPSS